MDPASERGIKPLFPRSFLRHGLWKNGDTTHKSMNTAKVSNAAATALLTNQTTQRKGRNQR